VSGDVQRIVDAHRKSLPRGTFISIRGQVETMRESYAGLITGLGLAIVLVYLLIVVNFQSWLDPFIIITALPAAMAGIVLMLFFTHTTLSVPALMGALMCVGVATANSILVVSFSKEKLEEGKTPAEAALEAGFADSSHFHKMMIRMFGISPSQFIKSSQYFNIITCDNSPLNFETSVYNKFGELEKVYR